MKSIFFCLIFVFSPFLKASECQTTSLKNIERVKLFSHTQLFPHYFFIVKNGMVLYHTSDVEDFNSTKDILENLQECSHFKEVKLEAGCTPLVSDNGYFILNNSSVFYNEYDYKLNDPWDTISSELKRLKNMKVCPVLNTWMGRPNYCGLEVSVNEDNICSTSCQLGISVSETPHSSMTPVISSFSGIYITRYEFRKTLENLDFLTTENLCHFPQFSPGTCVATKEKDHFKILVPNVATYEISSEVTEKMTEISLGGLCKDWSEKRHLLFYELSGKFQFDYFSFSIGNIPHRALGLEDFQKKISEYKKAGILKSSERKTCLPQNQDNSFIIKRDGLIIFKSNKQSNFLRAMSLLKKENYCL